MKDGTIVDIPDDAGPELLGRIAKANADMKPPEKGWMEQLGDKASGMMDEVGKVLPDRVKNIGTSAAKAVGFPLAYLADELAGATKPEPTNFLKQKVGEAGYQPKTVPEKYESSMVSGAVGAIMSPGSVVRNAIVGMISGGSGELAGQATKTPQNPEGSPIARIAASLLGGGVAAGAASLGGTKNDLAQAIMKNVTPQQARDATARMQQGKAAGLDYVASQALPDTPEVREIVNLLANHAAGKDVQQVLKNQAQNAAGGTRERVAALPGTVKSTQLVANDVQDAATDAITNATKARTDAVKGHYQAAGDVGEAGNKAVLSQIDAFLNQNGLSGAGKEIAKDLKKALQTEGPDVIIPGSPLILPGRTAPIPDTKTNNVTNALDLKSALDDALAKSKKMGTDANPTTPKTRGELKYLARQVYGELGDLSPEIAAGNAKYSQITQDVVNPLRKSITGTLAGPRGALEDKNSAKGASQSLFNGENPNAVGSAIGTAAQDTRAANPMAIPDAFKTHLSDAVENLPAKGNLAKILTEKLYDSPAQKTATERGLASMEQAQGLPSGALSIGFKRWLSLVEGVSNAPSKVGGITQSELSEIGGSNALSRGLGFMTISPFAGPKAATNKLYLNSALSQVDKLLATPEGINTLMELSKKSTSDKMAKSLMAAGVATGTSALEQQQRKEADK